MKSSKRLFYTIFIYFVEIIFEKWFIYRIFTIHSYNKVWEKYPSTLLNVIFWVGYQVEGVNNRVEGKSCPKNGAAYSLLNVFILH